MIGSVLALVCTQHHFFNPIIQGDEIALVRPGIYRMQTQAELDRYLKTFHPTKRRFLNDFPLSAVIAIHLPARTEKDHLLAVRRIQSSACETYFDVEEIVPMQLRPVTAVKRAPWIVLRVTGSINRCVANLSVYKASEGKSFSGSQGFLEEVCW